MRDHGTRACFAFGSNPGTVPGGCDCQPCRDANTAYEAERKKRTAPPYVDASRARAHVKALMAKGFGLKAQAKAAGVSATALSKIVYGDPRRGQALTKRIRPDNEKAILGLTLQDAPDSARTIEPHQHLEVIEELHRRGWTYTQIAERIGGGSSNLKPKARAKVTAGRYRAVQALLDEVPPLIGADERGHNAAAARRALGYDSWAARAAGEVCGATARHPSYGVRTCTEPAGHQPVPDQPSTSTEGWHESADHIRWAIDQALAARQDA